MSTRQSWTGDDTRDFDEPDPADCAECGAAADEPCSPFCQCEDCRDRQPSRQGDGDPGTEAA